MRKLILINGLIASGKNTIGKELSKKYATIGIKTDFFDLDQEVTRLNPKDYWENDGDRLTTWLNARKNYAIKINQSQKDTIVMAGPFFTKEEIIRHIQYLDNGIEVFLFTLDTPLEIRLERNKHRRPSNNPQDIINKEKVFQSLKSSTYGQIVNNTFDIDTVLSKIMSLIEDNQGVIKKEEFE